ncbi:MAG: prepilin-type N-terminal cleavage/methylation domain-containing protein [Eubacteriales bacterium]
MKHHKKSSKGFTLIELLITLAILLIVVTLSYQTFYYIYKSYDKNEENWIVQQDVRMVSDWIDKNIQTAYILEIYDANPASFTADDSFYYIFNDADGHVYIRAPKETSAILLAGESIEVDFSFIDTAPNALKYVITGNDLKTRSEKVYSVEGTLLILNIPVDKKINQGSSAGTVNTDGACIKFKSTADADGIGEMVDYVG